jgi:hypothetical protein
MYTVPGSSYQEMNNPLAMLSLPGDLNWSHKFVANFAADLNIGYGVKYRISYGADLSFWGSDGYTPLYYLSGNNKATITNAHQSSNRGTVWQLENVLTWDKTFNKHTINLVAGQSAMQNTGMNLYGALQNLKDINKPFMNNTSADRTREKARIPHRPSSRRRDGSRGMRDRPAGEGGGPSEEGTDGSRSACRHVRAACGRGLLILFRERQAKRPGRRSLKNYARSWRAGRQEWGCHNTGAIP